MRKTMMIAVLPSLALGSATMVTGTTAFAHGGGGGGHFGGGGRGHFAGGHFGRAFRGGFEGLYGFGDGFDYGESSCYVLTPSGYVWVCY